MLVSDLADDELAALGLAAAAEAIARARADGYAIVREEFEAGLVAAAAPIRDAAGPHHRRAQRLGAALPLRRRLEEAAALPRRGRRTSSPRELRGAARSLHDAVVTALAPVRRHGRRRAATSS